MPKKVSIMQDMERERFVIALLECPTQKAVCERLGISREQARVFMKDEHVIALLSEYQRFISEHFLTRLCDAGTGALNTLIEIYEDKDAKPFVRVAAAKAVIENVVSSVKNKEVEARINDLERLARNLGRL